MANGVTIYAPGGGGVWNTPTIDPVRNAVYSAQEMPRQLRRQRQPMRSWRSI
jgi:hypothetical protein